MSNPGHFQPHFERDGSSGEPKKVHGFGRHKRPIFRRRDEKEKEKFEIEKKEIKKKAKSRYCIWVIFSFIFYKLTLPLGVRHKRGLKQIRDVNLKYNFCD